MNNILLAEVAGPNSVPSSTIVMTLAHSAITARDVHFILAPRAVRRKPRTAQLAMVQHIFTALFVLATLWVLSLVPIRIYVARSGTPVTGIVDDTSSTVVKGNTVYSVHFHYELNGRQHKDSAEIDGNEYVFLSDGDPLPGRAAEIGGMPICLLPGHWLKNTILIGIGGLLMCLYAVLIVRAFVFAPSAQRRLLSDGQPVDGKITEITFKGNKVKTPWLGYQFTPLESREPVKGKQRIPIADARNIQLGHPLLILYDQANPQRNIPYLYSDYVIESLPMPT